MPEAEGALVAPLDEIHGPWAEGWGWPLITATAEDADILPPADGDVSAEADTAEDQSAPADSPADLLPVQDASEDVFRFDFAPTGGAAEETHDPATIEGVTLDQMDIAALIAGGTAVTFLADWDFGVVTVQVQASEGTPAEDGGQGFEVVLSAVGSPEVNASWL